MKKAVRLSTVQVDQLVDIKLRLQPTSSPTRSVKSNQKGTRLMKLEKGCLRPVSSMEEKREIQRSQPRFPSHKSYQIRSQAQTRKYFPRRGSALKNSNPFKFYHQPSLPRTNNPESQQLSIKYANLARDMTPMRRVRTGFRELTQNLRHSSLSTKRNTASAKWIKIDPEPWGHTQDSNPYIVFKQ